uniref:Uncharacterized protein n=1 Tax=Helianthus annuus TaxID=4232 RepID=A0A251T0M1_HELAN
MIFEPETTRWVTTRRSHRNLFFSGSVTTYLCRHRWFTLSLHLRHLWLLIITVVVVK